MRQYTPESESQKASAPPEDAVMEAVKSDNEILDEEVEAAGDESLNHHTAESDRKPTSSPLSGMDKDQDDDFVVLPDTRGKS